MFEQHHRKWIGIVALTLVTLLTWACDRKPDAVHLDSHEAKPRFVSFSPALSQMLVDLGQADLLVAVARNDDAAPPNLPVVGDLFEPNIEALLASRPSTVFMMVGKEGPPARIVELANQKKFTLVTYPTPKSINDLGNILMDDKEMLTILAPGNPLGTPGSNSPSPAFPGDGEGGEGAATTPGNSPTKTLDLGHGTLDTPASANHSSPSLGMVLGLPMKAYKLKYDMLSRLALISEAAAAGKRQRVLMVLNAGEAAADLPMASGPGTVHDQLLGFLNASNAASEATVYAPVFDREKLLAIAPDVILILSPKARPLGNINDDIRLRAYLGLDIPAVKNQRIVLVSDPLVLLPSSSLPRIGALMAKAIHPELSSQIDAVMNTDLNRAHSQPASQPTSAPAIPSTMPSNHARE